MAVVLRSLYVALAVLELPMKTRLASTHRDPPASASRVLGSKACATTPGHSQNVKAEPEESGGARRAV